MTADKNRPFVVRAGTETEQTAQSEGARRLAGVSPGATPSSKIWLGKVSNAPGYRSVPHHHGEAETAGYVLKGRARIYFGRKYSEFVDLEAGDFVFVPPRIPHIEANLSEDAELVWLTARTPDNVVVNLPDVDDADLPGGS
ncbi:cupin domain-containing protein [Embleya sp. NPDC001921]